MALSADQHASSELRGVDICVNTNPFFFQFNQWDFILPAGFKCHQAALFTFLYEQMFLFHHGKNRRLNLNVVQLHVLAWKSRLELNCSFILLSVFFFFCSRVIKYMSSCLNPAPPPPAPLWLPSRFSHRRTFRLSEFFSPLVILFHRQVVDSIFFLFSVSQYQSVVFFRTDSDWLNVIASLFFFPLTFVVLSFCPKLFEVEMLKMDLKAAVTQCCCPHLKTDVKSRKLRFSRSNNQYQLLKGFSAIKHLKKM